MSNSDSSIELDVDLFANSDPSESLGTEISSLSSEENESKDQFLNFNKKQTSQNDSSENTDNETTNSDESKKENGFTFSDQTLTKTKPKKRSDNKSKNTEKNEFFEKNTKKEQENLDNNQEIDAQKSDFDNTDEDWDQEFLSQNDTSGSDGKNNLDLLKNHFHNSDSNSETEEDENEFPEEWRILKNFKTKKIKENLKQYDEATLFYNDLINQKNFNNEEFQTWICTLINKHEEKWNQQSLNFRKKFFIQKEIKKINNKISFALFNLELITCLIELDYKKLEIRNYCQNYFFTINEHYFKNNNENKDNKKTGSGKGIHKNNKKQREKKAEKDMEKEVIFEISLMILKKYLILSGLIVNPFFIETLKKLSPNKELLISLLQIDGESHCYKIPKKKTVWSLTNRYIEIYLKAKKICKNENDEYLLGSYKNYLLCSTLTSLHLHLFGISPITGWDRCQNEEFNTKWKKLTMPKELVFSEGFRNSKFYNKKLIDKLLNTKFRIKKLLNFFKLFSTLTTTMPRTERDFNFLKARVGFSLSWSNYEALDKIQIEKILFESIYFLDQLPENILENKKMDGK